MGNLSLLIERIYNNKVDPVLVYMSGTWSFSCCQEGKVRTTLNSKPFCVKANIFKLVELQEADKLFIWMQVHDVVSHIVCLQCVLKNNFRVTKIVADARKICLILIEHIGPPLNNIILITGVDIPHRLWQLSA